MPENILSTNSPLCFVSAAGSSREVGFLVGMFCSRVGVDTSRVVLSGGGREQWRPQLQARFAAGIDVDGGTRRRGELRAVRHPAEHIGHVPIRYLTRARHVGTALNVLGVAL